MTSLAFLHKEVLNVFKRFPPFCISMTLNASTRETFDEIVQVDGLFEQTLHNIRTVRQKNLPLEIKTLLSKRNIHEVKKIKRLIESFSCKFTPDILIFARLNKDTSPCAYRLEYNDFKAYYKLNKESHCDLGAYFPTLSESVNQQRTMANLFECAIGGWQWFVNPRGQLNLCTTIREPAFNLLTGDLETGVRKLSRYVSMQKRLQSSPCIGCQVKQYCLLCPGIAKLENGDWGSFAPYFCQLSRLFSADQKDS
jgi:radical SAM protein with 4Fe4S-binding SPASM domain